jgi:hypothetical protein
MIAPENPDAYPVLASGKQMEVKVNEPGFNGNHWACTPRKRKSAARRR